MDKAPSRFAVARICECDGSIHVAQTSDMRQISRPSGGAGRIYETIVRLSSKRPQLVSSHVILRYFKPLIRRKCQLKLMSVGLLILFSIVCKTVPEGWQMRFQ